ncbi:MAG: DUF2147 domain-containing protein [Proteobacteria bacterium]|nr:DUF2147 domain-containing protein [Pseudomonadota bacterium]
MKILLWTILLLLTAATAFGADQNAILGIWKTEMGESKVQIYRCGEKICGTIIWLKNPRYTDSRDGEIGTPVIDRKNPDPALKSRPVLDLHILNGFSAEGGNNWGNGTCYDPKSGNTYRGKIHLAAPDRLELRGYIGIPLFGRTSVWTR